MADILKPSILDPMETELSKPSAGANAEAEAYCATVISNYEGWKGVQIVYSKEGMQTTTDRLDARVRRLERMDGINPPPPMDTPSWDSLMWRVARLHRKMPMLPPGLNKLAAAPPHITATIPLLKSVVGCMHWTGSPSWTALVEKDADFEEDELLRAMAQFLSYVAGTRRHKVTGTFDLKDNCKLALDLSLEENPFVATGPRPPPGMRPPPPRVVPVPCCHRCPCHNGNKQLAAKPSILRWMTGKYNEERRAKRMTVGGRIAGAFRKLAFWRRSRYPDTDSDTSSISTRSSSTFA
ncbi:hypothetical protein F4777DRAFT_578438 [Nemania sp. FL0916]|nr:hypothetical protein F4777DRAFT_578438 [Nemania sp. FL0916]